MTMIAAFKTKIEKSNIIFMACDSRVNFPTESGKEIAYTDEAHKIIQINERLLIAYSGDYYFANEAISSVDISVIDFTKSEFEIASIVSNQLCNSFRGKNTDFFICAKNKNWELYKIDSCTFIPQPKVPGLHLIGMGEHEQSEFRNAHENARNSIVPNSFEGFYINPLLSAFNNCYGQDINGLVSIYILDDRGVTRAGIAQNRDGENWVADSPEGDTTRRFVNGRPFGSTNLNYKKVHDDRNNYYNTLSKFLQKKRRK